MNNYLIPANSKKSQLIFSIFTWQDLVLFGVGLAVSLILMATIRTDDIFVMALLVAPAVISGALVLPIPNYHNVKGFFKSMISFFRGNKQYYWKGWCVKDVYGRDYEDRKKF